MKQNKYLDDVLEAPITNFKEDSRDDSLSFQVIQNEIYAVLKKEKNANIKERLGGILIDQLTSIMNKTQKLSQDLANRLSGYSYLVSSLAEAHYDRNASQDDLDNAERFSKESITLTVGANVENDVYLFQAIYQANFLLGRLYTDKFNDALAKKYLDIAFENVDKAFTPFEATKRKEIITRLRPPSAEAIQDRFAPVVAEIISSIYQDVSKTDVEDMLELANCRIHRSDLLNFAVHGGKFVLSLAISDNDYGLSLQANTLSRLINATEKIANSSDTLHILEQQLFVKTCLAVIVAYRQNLDLKIETGADQPWRFSDIDHVLKNSYNLNVALVLNQELREGIDEDVKGILEDLKEELKNPEANSSKDYVAKFVVACEKIFQREIKK